MRTFVILLALIFQAEAPPKKTSPEEYLKKRAELLRQVGDLKAKLAALEIELQLLEEERAAAGVAPPPAGSTWRDSPDPAKPARARCASVTKDGKRCTRAAEPGKKYCWQHATAH
jgi:hypothetical protein